MKSKKTMKTQRNVFALCILVLASSGVIAQENTAGDNYHIQSLFKSKGSGGYGAITNKFTSIGGSYANMVGVYGGWYVNHSFLLGIGAAGLTNDIKVPLEDRVAPFQDLSYMYGQVGMVTEYVIASNKAVHVAFNLFSGAGFTMQYERYNWNHDHEFDWDGGHDEDWFFVAEPGVQVEVNLFKWMRFSPGVSYRAAFGSNGRGLGDSALSDISYNATFKFGKF
jgi:hypothetical protein